MLGLRTALLNLRPEGVDGKYHYEDDQPRKDKIRQERLESLGVRFIRIDDLDVKRDIKWVVNEIAVTVLEMLDKNVE